MKKQTHLHFGWPEGEYIFSKFIFLVNCSFKFWKCCIDSVRMSKSNHQRWHNWILNCIRSPKFAVCKLLQTVLVHNFKNIYLLFYLHWKCKCVLFCFIFAGPNIYSQSLAVLSGDLSVPFNITTTGHQLFLRWSADHGTNKKGFRITYVGEYQSMYPRLVIPFSSMCVSRDLLSVLPMTRSSKSVSHLSMCLSPNVCVFVCNFGVRKCNRSCLKTI